jgi:hypothetical protein
MKVDNYEVPRDHPPVEAGFVDAAFPQRLAAAKETIADLEAQYDLALRTRDGAAIIEFRAKLKDAWEALNKVENTRWPPTGPYPGKPEP